MIRWTLVANALILFLPLLLYFQNPKIQLNQIQHFKIDDLANINETLDPDFRKDEEITFIVEKPIDGKTRENATFLVLCRNYEVYDILKTIQNVQDRFNDRYNYDWVFLNDERFDGHFITSVTSFIRGGRISFGKVAKLHWSYPDWVDLDHARHMREQLAAKNVLYAESESYRHMCRFYLGFFYRHPLVMQYRYYWRVEPDVEFLCDINEDPFYVMRTTGKRYGFAISMFEYSDTIPTLWNHFLSYIKGKGKLLDFVQNPDKSYNLCHFWSNFEIAEVSLFANPDYDELFQYLDSTGGFFYERWGDAPVHTLAVLWLLEPHEIYWFDLGYRHLPYTQCPQSTTFRNRNRCVCDPESDFTFTYQSCTGHFLQLLR